MLFKPEHIEMIKKGTKTATRRIWKVPRVKLGGVYKCKTKMLSKDYFAKIRVQRLYSQKLSEMLDLDAKKEGYSDMASFKDIWIRINGGWLEDQEVIVIEFEVEPELIAELR
jgi:hypothetical protein